jgi:hypothetical protein
VRRARTYFVSYASHAEEHRSAVSLFASFAHLAGPADLKIHNEIVELACVLAFRAARAGHRE